MRLVFAGVDIAAATLLVCAGQHHCWYFKQLCITPGCFAAAARSKGTATDGCMCACTYALVLCTVVVGAGRFWHQLPSWLQAAAARNHHQPASKRFSALLLAAFLRLGSTHHTPIEQRASNSCRLLGRRLHVIRQSELVHAVRYQGASQRWRRSTPAVQLH